MRIKDLMTQKIELVDPATAITEVARVMRDSDVGVLPVVEGDRLTGVVTDRDIVVRALANGKNPETTPVREAMSGRVLYCFDDQSTDEVARNMGEQQIRRLPVVNRDKRLVGIVTLGDLSAGGATREAGAALGLISEEAH
jgi:CBS domain-containing protein